VESGLSSISAKADVLTTSLDRTSTKIGKTADKFNNTAEQLNLTAVEYKKLAMSVNGLISENRKTFNSSLKNFDLLSVDLRKTVNTLNPSLIKLNTTLSKVNSDKLAKDLEGVLSNANQTSLNLKNISANLNDPRTLTILQQTLDSARSTFQNTQKITADLDDLTGNPEFRSNIKNLVNGLGKLVSSTEQLEQQAKLAQTIEPLGRSLSYASKLPAPNPQISTPGQVSISPNLNPTIEKIEPSTFNKLPLPNLPIKTPGKVSNSPNLNPTTEKIESSTFDPKYRLKISNSATEIFPSFSVTPDPDPATSDNGSSFNLNTTPTNQP
jgi:phospholipid/cholesterol/gamma-HCH transport system substrate-binding protein